MNLAVPGEVEQPHRRRSQRVLRSGRDREGLSLSTPRLQATRQALSLPELPTWGEFFRRDSICGCLPRSHNRLRSILPTMHRALDAA